MLYCGRVTTRMPVIPIVVQLRPWHGIGAPIVWAPQLSESDSPQVQNPLSTNKNKGGSVQNPPKPTINLVPKKDIPAGDATTS